MDSYSKPYEYYTLQEDDYSFVTDAGDEYRCYFLSYASVFRAYPDIAAYVFGFNIERINKVPLHKGVDERIAATIVKIVGAFLESATDVVVYVCDTSDGRGASRMRKFTGWFEFYTHESNKIWQMTTHFDGGGVVIYAALLLNKQNPNKTKFIEAFIELTEQADK